MRSLVTLLILVPVGVAMSNRPLIAQDVPIIVGDSGTGYVDSALVRNQFRLRFDAARGINQPNRSEFLWAWPPPGGTGPALDESSADYQSVSAYLEYAVDRDVSVFLDAPLVMSDPVINNNATAIGDVQTGVKVQLFDDCASALTFQMKVYVPTGPEEDTIGTGHVSFEPGLLFYRQMQNWTLEGELRYWIPVGGTSGRQGDVIRYGLGASKDLSNHGLCGVRPVIELVGWTFLEGQSRFLSGGVPRVQSASGDTVVNLKIGSRFRISDCQDFYVGYGHALTGDRIYRDIFRAEVRFRF
ncbi:MAG: hypothetical protein O3A00_04185 [Planctomycetota bacterium]|nr:hypothetical protein [Planctomycetota bacterium]